MDPKKLSEEMIVIRGPVPLEHNRELTANDGHLGRISTAQSWFKGALRKGALWLLAGIATCSGGAVLAVRTYLIDQGRALERKEQDQRMIRRLDLRVKCLEGNQRACDNVDSDHQDVVTP